MLTVYDRSINGRNSYRPPESTAPDYELRTDMREKCPALPCICEVDAVRHYTALSLNSFGVDNGFYPLGSCTMKYNPKINEIAASLEGFTGLHPLQRCESAQGALELMYLLNKQLKSITGMEFALSPAAGAHGEYSGLKIIKAYHQTNRQIGRNKILVPDSAHGTNPASAALAGFTTVNIPSLDDGSVDLEALRGACGADTAGFMLTNPNTLGLFEGKIKEIAQTVHSAGGLMYYDGANLNAVMGVVRPADMGFDIVHLNLHKTFSTPHGGGGPGAGPVGTVERLKEFLPWPKIEKDGGKYVLCEPIKSVGKIKAFYGNFLVLVRAYVYILTLGAEGVRDAAQKAVLNANYLKKLLEKIDSDKDRRCMHEFVLSFKKLKEETKVSALDVAKSLIDANMHPPTMYFPLIVPEALMFEPTETESKTTLEECAQKLLDIVKKAYSEPDLLHAAPVTTDISRPDETAAARNAKLRIPL